MRAGKRERAAMWLKSDVDTDCEKARTSIPSSANARRRRRGQKETRTVALKTRDGVSETVEEENWRTRMEDEKDGRKRGLRTEEETRQRQYPPKGEINGEIERNASKL